jgi:hypothetical protein
MPTYSLLLDCKMAAAFLQKWLSTHELVVVFLGVTTEVVKNMVINGQLTASQLFSKCQW